MKDIVSGSKDQSGTITNKQIQVALTELGQQWRENTPPFDKERVFNKICDSLGSETVANGAFGDGQFRDLEISYSPRQPEK